MASASSIIIDFPGYPGTNLLSVDSLAALRTRAVLDLDEGQNIIVDYGATIGDGLGGIYVWSAASLANDDQQNVIRPNSIPVLQAGRWLAIAAVPSPGSVSSKALASGEGAGLVGYRLPTVTARARSLLDRTLELPVSVNDFVNPSETDDTGAFQRAFDYALEKGGTVIAPATRRYKVSSNIVCDGSGQTLPTDPRVSFVGDSSRATIIDIGAGDFDAFTFIGSNGVSADAQAVIQGLNFNKDGRQGRNLTLRQYSHLAMRDVKSNGGEIGIDCVDFQESHFENVLCAFGVGGMRLRVGTFTAPNAITLYNCKMGNNTQWGLEALNAVALNIDGGSFESNKCDDLSKPSFGIRLAWDDDFQIEGTVGLNVSGAYIEQNGHLGTSVIPTGDIWVQNNKGPMAMSIKGTTFQRINNYCRNNIRIETAGDFISTLSLDGNGHQPFPYENGYTPSADRPYVFLSQPRNVYVNAGANRYVSEIERPDFSRFNNLGHDAMAQAWVLFDGTGALGIKQYARGMNIDYVLHTLTGGYEVHFARNMRDEFFVPLIILPNGLQHEVVTTTPDHVAFTVRNPAGDLVDIGRVSVVVYGLGY